MTRLLLLGAALLMSLTAVAQNVVAYREAPLTGGGPYFLNGTAIIEELDNGSFQFRLSNDYSTNSGPDVQIYLTNNGTFSSPINLNGTLFIEDVGTEAGPNQPGISHFSGAYSKTLSTLGGLNQYDHVVFVCVRFGQLHWGNGTFGNTINACTATNATLNETACGAYTAPSGAIYTMSGTYQDTIANAGGCDSLITLNLSISNIDASVSNSGTVLSANMPNANYQWIDCNNGNAPISGANGQDFTPVASGSYAVIVTDGNCSDTSACNSVTLTNVQEADLNSSFELYPNPATATVVVDLRGMNAQEDLQIEMLDLTGKQIFRKMSNGKEEFRLDLRELEAGMYFVRVSGTSGSQMQRLIKW